MQRNRPPSAQAVSVLRALAADPARCRSAAVAHPAIDPPIMPTLMPVAPRTPWSATLEVTAIRQFNGHIFPEEADGTRPEDQQVTPQP